jgi:hypothetical protein
MFYGPATATRLPNTHHQQLGDRTHRESLLDANRVYGITATILLSAVSISSQKM